MIKKKRIGYGLLGTTLDMGGGASRWGRWRPTLSIFQQEDFALDEYHLLYGRRFSRMAEQVKADLRNLSPALTLVDHLIEFEDPWDFEEVYQKLLDLIEEQNFDQDAEDYFFHITTGTHVAQICIFLLTESRRFPGQLLQTSPERNGKRGPEGQVTLIDLDLSKYDSLASRFQRQAETGEEFLKSGIATRNATFNNLISQIEKVAIRSVEPILLTGPTGAGKSSLARRIYELRRQRGGLKGPFVEVNCATLRGDSAISTLFGHVKGSFTGALGDRPGLLKQADNGLIFLDEIGELGIDEQAMLLHAIEEKRFFALGADRESSSNFGLICGTNRDLFGEVKRGVFREDLLARINLWTFQLPGLRDRPEDLLPNLEFELATNEKNSGKRVTFNKEALGRFMQFATSSQALWKANFRDLNGAIKRLCALAPSARITIEGVKEEIARLNEQWGLGNRSADQADPLLPSDLDEFDRLQLSGVLNVCRESASLAEAGRRLFSKSRLQRASLNDSDRLKKYLARFNLNWEQISKQTS